MNLVGSVNSRAFGINRYREFRERCGGTYFSPVGLSLRRIRWIRSVTIERAKKTGMTAAQFGFFMSGESSLQKAELIANLYADLMDAMPGSIAEGEARHLRPRFRCEVMIARLEYWRARG